MKKVFSLSLLLVAALTLGFTSCKKDDNVKPDDGGGDNGGGTEPTIETVQEDLLLYQCVNLGDVNGKGLYLYNLQFISKGAVENGKVTKDGRLYTFAIIPTSAPESPTANPPAGTYKLSKGLEPTTIVDYEGNAGNVTNVEGIVGGKLDGAKIAFVEAELVIAADKVTFKGKTTEGKEIAYDLTYTGELVTKSGKDLNYEGYEPAEQTTINETYTKGAFEYYAKSDKRALPVLFFSVEKADDKFNFCSLKIFLPEAAAVNTPMPEGVYPVQEETEPLTPQTVVASIGAFTTEDGGKAAFTFMSPGEKKGYYFIVSGQLTVTANDATLVGKSYFGSDITCTYTGDLTMTPGAAQGAPQRVVKF